MYASAMPSASPAAKTGPPASSVVADSGAVTKRLQQELMSIMCGGDAGVSAFPNGDSLFNWVGTIAGPEGTAYDGLSFRLSLTFTAEYPFKAPTVKFETPCFHPNVDLQGNICLDILKEKWSAAYSVATVLQSIRSLLGDANIDSPLNVHAAKMWDGNPAEYKDAVLKTYNSKRAAS